MIAVAFHEWQFIVRAANHHPAASGIAGTRELFHELVTECRVVHRDLFAGSYFPARHQVQSFQPRAGVAGMIDRLPVLGVVTPAHKDFVRQRPGILRKPLLLRRIPVLPDVFPAHQNVRLFFIGFDDFTGFDGLDGIHAVMTFAVQEYLPFLVLPPVSFQSGFDDLFKEVAVAPGLLEQNKIGAA